MAGHVGDKQVYWQRQPGLAYRPGTKGRALKGVMLQLCPAGLNSHACRAIWRGAHSGAVSSIHALLSAAKGLAGEGSPPAPFGLGASNVLMSKMAELAFSQPSEALLAQG